VKHQNIRVARIGYWNLEGAQLPPLETRDHVGQGGVTGLQFQQKQNVFGNISLNVTRISTAKQVVEKVFIL